MGFVVRDSAHLQPAVALAIIRLPKSPAEAPCICGKKDKLLLQTHKNETKITGKTW